MITPYQFTILQQLLKGATIRKYIYRWRNLYYIATKDEWPTYTTVEKVSSKDIKCLEKLGLLTRRVAGVGNMGCLIEGNTCYVWEIYRPGIMNSTNPILHELKAQIALGTISYG